MAPLRFFCQICLFLFFTPLSSPQDSFSTVSWRETLSDCLPAVKARCHSCTHLPLEPVYFKRRAGIPFSFFPLSFSFFSPSEQVRGGCPKGGERNKIAGDQRGHQTLLMLPFAVGDAAWQGLVTRRVAIDRRAGFHCRCAATVAPHNILPPR